MPAKSIGEMKMLLNGYELYRIWFFLGRSCGLWALSNSMAEKIMRNNDGIKF